MSESISLKLKAKRKELKLSQDEMARIIGVDQKTISHWENGINEPQLNKLRIFCDNFQIPVSYFTGESVSEIKNTVKIDFYHDVYASCGLGGLVASEDKETLEIPETLMPMKMKNDKKYSIIKTRGNSMNPEIKDGDLVLIEHYNGEQIIDNAIYLFMYENEVFVKRLSKNINEIIITSDNKDYPQIILKSDEINRLNIIGKVFGFARKYF
ncbi:MAG: XRE family transcriptional regulator [Candidatus Gastranaerophilales bacterium]|nr:XRE family transcriptional regulator [Candidatus Gastranaerophilales bacterium]